LFGYIGIIIIALEIIGGRRFRRNFFKNKSVGVIYFYTPSRYYKIVVFSNFMASFFK
jgi:hypothetical protein